MMNLTDNSVISTYSIQYFNNVNTTSSGILNLIDNSIGQPLWFKVGLALCAIIIFVIGIIGNLLVVIVVAKNAHMRTITNIFIVNLAIGDFFVILICLPPSIIQDISSQWYFGELMCKIMPYVQNISVCVSVMTLTSISYERYYAIVYPLKFQATKFRAKIFILIIWILAVLVNLPFPIVIELRTDSNLTYCYPTWDPIYQNMFDLLIFLILYILPMALIFYTYTRVVKVLWKIDKSIAWDQNENNSTSRSKTYTFPRASQSNHGEITYTLASGSSMAKSKMKNQLIARRKAAKMLISVAIIFAICYLPIHLLNILRFIGSDRIEEALNKYATIIFPIAHCLVYLNSCINPLIYNFMSDNFRKEFSRVLFCKSSKNKNALDSDIHIKYLNGVSNVYSSQNINRSINNMNRPTSNYTFVTNLNQTSFKSNLTKVLTNSQNSLLKKTRQVS